MLRWAPAAGVDHPAAWKGIAGTGRRQFGHSGALIHAFHCINEPMVDPTTDFDDGRPSALLLSLDLSVEVEFSDIQCELDNAECWPSERSHLGGNSSVHGTESKTSSCGPWRPTTG